MSFLQSFINNTLNDRQIKFKKTLDPDNKSELKNHVFNKNDDNLNDKCPITMKTFDDGEHITCLPCGHLFDSESIEEWVLNEQATCPVCRFELKHTKEIRTTPLQPVHQATETANSGENNVAPINSIIPLTNLFNMILNTNINTLSQSLGPLNDISGNDISGNDVSGNDVSGDDVSGNDISGNDVSGNDISGNDVSGNDSIRNRMRDYLSLIDRIIYREIDQEENNIMQEAILASLRDQ